MVPNLSRLPSTVLILIWGGLCALGCKGEGGGSSPDIGGGGAEVTIETHCNDDDDCQDGKYCNGKEICRDGWCRSGKRVDCDDGVSCTDDVCDETSESCKSTPPDRDGDGVADAKCKDRKGKALGTDCDDQDALRYPGAAEVCDPEQRDEDCDPTTFGTTDRDHDGYVDAQCCNLRDDDTLHCGLDCDDLKVSVNPTGTEVCDGLDNDCDGETDEGVSTMVFPDRDHDGRGDEKAKKVSSCPGWVGVATVGGDCDDSDAEVFEGQFEICDGKDNNCNGEVDEIREQAPWFVDKDEDTFGDPEGSVVYSCYRIKGRVLSHNDCDDSDPKINRNAAEACDAKDNNCNGLMDFRVGTNDFEDDDHDGVADEQCGGEDCADQDARTAAGAPEVCDRVDNDCDGEVDEQTVQDIWYVDEDGDGWGMVQGNALASCYPLPNRTTRYGDCDDADPDIFPGAMEECDGIDNDCNGITDEKASLFCDGEHSISFCQEGACEVFTCLPGYFLDEEDPGSGCQPASEVESPLACQVDNECNDGNVCNGIETCIDGACKPGFPVNCGGSTTLFGDALIANGLDVQALLGIETITGNLTVQSPFLTSLVGLESLKTVGGHLFIRDNTLLERLSGSALSALETVGGDVIIERNPSLKDVDLPSLTSAYSIVVQDNQALSRVVGYGNLVSVGYRIAIRQNPSLKDVLGFSALQYLGGAHLQEDPESGGCASETAGGLRLSANPELSNVAAFEELQLIEGDLCVGDYFGAPLFFPELTELKMFARISGGASLDFPKLTHIGRNLTYLGRAQETTEGSASPVSLEFPNLASARGLHLTSDALPAKKLDLRKVEEVDALSIDFSDSELRFSNLDLSHLASAGSVYLDLPGPELSAVLLSSLEIVEGDLYVRVRSPKLGTLDLTELASAGSVKVFAEEMGGSVELLLDHLISVSENQDPSALSLCTGTLITEAPVVYQTPACSQAQALLDSGFPAEIEDVTCDQCGSAIVTCAEECDDGNECTTDECVEGECVFFARTVGTACSVGYCGSGATPTCVTCIDDEESADAIDTGCSAGAPQCVLVGSVPTCAGCTADTECDSPSQCTIATCQEGFCEVQNRAQGATCSTGVCDRGACVECIEGGDECGEQFCDGGSCVECLNDEHCPGGVCNGGSCVECLQNSHCDDQNQCTRNLCVEQTCSFPALTRGTTCSSGVCDGDACVSCIDDSTTGVDSGCDSADPRCVQSNGPRCVECESNGQCSASGECKVASCSAGSCQTSNAAAGTACSLGVCNAAGTCTECISHENCPGGACSSGSCVSCVDDQAGSTQVDTGCNTAAPQCLMTAEGPACAGCANDNQCQTSNQCAESSCVGGFCQVGDADQGTPCSGGVCNQGSCVECIAGGSQCGDQYCDAGSCVDCLNDQHCEGGFCNGGLCVECLTAGNCNDQNECTTDSCTNGACSNTSRAAGSACGDGWVCNGATSPQCVECVNATQCNDGVSCTADSCQRNTCVSSPDDSLCPPANACETSTCTPTGCQTVDIGQTVWLIDKEFADGGFENGLKTSWQRAATTQRELIVERASTAGGATTPFDGSWMAWLGGIHRQDSTQPADLTTLYSAPFEIPEGASLLRLMIDTSFQIAEKGETPDKLTIDLMGVEGSPLGNLATILSTDSQVRTSNAWLRNGIAVEVDASKLVGRGAQLVIQATVDAKDRTDFLLDNVRLSVEVCP